MTPALPFLPNASDFVAIISHSQERAIRQLRKVLRPGGFLQFSILHPCFVPPHRKVLREPNGTTRAIEVAGYFDTIDGRIDTFRFENLPEEERQKSEPFRVPRFHRTLSGWVELIVDAGLMIECFAEPRVTVEVAKAKPALEDMLVAPIFLHIRARKPAE
jgi:SAM-dependent methyltransferase